jgi:molecular chaperone DnaK (HSP70)
MDDPVTLADLFAQAEVSKLRLSTQADASFQISHEGQERVLCLTRATFDELTGHLLGRCLELTRDLLRVARGMGCGAIDRMLLVGGSTRMPQIRRGLIEAFEVETVVLDGEDVVAKGAALYGFQDSLQRRVEEYLPETQDADGGFDARGVTPSALREALDRVEDTCGLRLSLPMREFVRTRIVNVLGKGLGLLACNEHGEDAAVYLLPRNSEVPVARTAEFGTDQHNQAAVEIRVVAGEQESADPFECQEVGLVVLELPPGLPAHSPIHVTFAIDRDGRLSVQALDVRGGGSIHVEFETDAILSEEQLAQRSERLSLLKVS